MKQVIDSTEQIKTKPANKSEIILDLIFKKPIKLHMHLSAVENMSAANKTSKEQLVANKDSFKDPGPKKTIRDAYSKIEKKVKT